MVFRRAGAPVYSITVHVDMAVPVLTELETFEGGGPVATDARSPSGSAAEISTRVRQTSDGFVSCSDEDDWLPLSGASGSRSGTASQGGSQVLGLLQVEVVGAEHVPLGRVRLNQGGPQSPFVVLSCGRRSFRTRVVPRSTDPVWQERLYLPVTEREAGYHASLAVYNYRALGVNNCIGSVPVEIGEFVGRPDRTFRVALPLNVEPEDADAGRPCRLFIKCGFFTMGHLRHAFWHALCRHFDPAGRGALLLADVEALLGCVGPGLADECLDAVAAALGAAGPPFDYDTVAGALAPLGIASSAPADADARGHTAVIGECPVCGKRFRASLLADDLLVHVNICVSRDATGRLEREMMGGFLTEEHASRKWLSRVFSSFGFGNYQLGRNNANIFVHDRASGKLIEERMPAYIRLGIRMIYSQQGRAADLGMVRRLLHSMTLRQGQRFSSAESARSIPGFIRFHQLSLEDVRDPLGSFRSFNEFFFRKLKPGARPAASADPAVTLIPADCRFVCFPTVTEATRVWIKGARFSVASLLMDEAMGAYYEGGSIAVCRLAPQDYHRFHAPFEASVNFTYHLPGAYFTVNPMAVRKAIDVYTENARTVVLLDSPVYGRVAYVAVGAMMVGSILLTCEPGQALARLDEIGYFAFGGSTIVMVFPRGSHRFDADLLKDSAEGLETLVRVGQSMGGRETPPGGSP